MEQPRAAYRAFFSSVTKGRICDDRLENSNRMCHWKLRWPRCCAPDRNKHRWIQRAERRRGYRAGRGPGEGKVLVLAWAWRICLKVLSKRCCKFCIVMRGSPDSRCARIRRHRWRHPLCTALFALADARGRRAMPRHHRDLLAHCDRSREPGSGRCMRQACFL